MDIVQELKRDAAASDADPMEGDVRWRAAAEIERLRAALAAAETRAGRANEEAGKFRSAWRRNKQ